MKNIILCFILLSFLGFKSKNNLKCEDFHIGKFELINKTDNRKYILQRQKTFQSEETFDLKTGKKIGDKRFYNLKWMNDCEYILLIDTLKSKFDEDDIYINSNGGLRCRINEIKSNSATIITSFHDNSVKSVISKIN
ncbi:hypothetical protein LUD75_06595 [Epilithonimonas sp. JDS]|uniref:hypothetical protein n=1 Tax=Epilithonimonas sp. JDS TaxID=2902797 RepID=UPI001E4A5A10|nr:hypothetical protein [Epilithonimonas sp. JDS]MCD9854365.1 hypothetical protein [Epilithonimonas sp. JDS]